jgi:hypothetical protein
MELVERRAPCLFQEDVMKVRTGFWLIVAVLTASACASGGSAGSGIYQRDIGNATRPDFNRLTTLMLARWHYEVLQIDSIPFIRVETHWRTRQPFDDERALGVNTAESRVIITARQRAESLAGPVLNIRLIVENRVRLAQTVEWNEKTNTAMFRSYADSLTAMFKNELINIGVRVY